MKISLLRFKKMTSLFVLGIICLPVLVQAKSSNITSKKKQIAEANAIKSDIGLNIPKWGLAIDAVFDPRLDDIIPDYHILNIVVSNRRPEPIMFNAKDDRWMVVDSEGHKHAVQNNVEDFDKKLWEKLPERLKNMLEYPTVVNSGKSITIDVFVPKTVNLFNFREVTWKSSHFNKEFSILTTYEQELSLPNDKEFDTPRNSSTVVNFDQLMEQQSFKTNPQIDSSANLDSQTLDTTTLNGTNNDRNSVPTQNTKEPLPFNPNLDNVIILDQ